MMIWLPPSEGKVPPPSGPSLDLASLSRPTLTDARSQVLEALKDLGTGEEAERILKVGVRARASLEANLHLFNAPTRPASQLFTGVLYSALSSFIPQLWAHKGSSSIAIFSGLFGVLSPSDLIPDHRLAMGVSLPPFGVLSTWWGHHLEEVMRGEAQDRLVLDMRSSAYRIACKAPWARMWEIQILREQGGVRKVVTHDAKRWRGALTGTLLAMDAHTIDSAIALDAIEDAASSLTLPDARGAYHRVIAVEASYERPTRRGGSTRKVTLVTD